MTPPSLVFVYGTLRRGGSNNFRMDGFSWIGPAAVNGHLYEVSWYPALVLDENAGEVVGDLYKVSEEGLAALDEFEGSEYRRTRTMVQNSDNEAESAWVWAWNKPTEGLQPIPGGDWLMVDPGVNLDDPSND